MEHPEDSIEVADTGTADVIDSDDIEALRFEILRLRDAIAGAATHEAVLDDRVKELEMYVENIARLTSNPAVRALLAVTRPARRYLERRRTPS